MRNAVPGKPEKLGKAGKRRSRSWIAGVVGSGLMLFAGACGVQTSPVTTPVSSSAPVSLVAPSPVATPTTTPTDSSSATPPPPAAGAAHAPAVQAPQPASAPPAITHQATSCGSGSYVNSDGNCVPRPVKADSPPVGATARCKDGTYSFSQHRQGTCSGHGGVAAWL